MVLVAVLRVCCRRPPLSCGPFPFLFLSATRRVFSHSAVRSLIPRSANTSADTDSYPHHHLYIRPPQLLLQNRPLRNRIAMNSSDPYVVPDSDNDDDPDLALAIKLSLQGDAGSGSPPHKRPFSFTPAKAESSKSAAAKRKVDCIVISDTESDEDMAPPSKKTPKTAAWDAQQQRGMNVASNSSSLLGLDRGQMERERLARLRIRSPELVSCDTRESLRTSIPLAVRGAPAPTPGARFGSSSRTHSDPGFAALALEFPHGVVKRTWAYGTDREGIDIKIEEVLRGETLIGAVLSAFQWDYEWLWSKIPNGRLQRFVLVVQAKTKADKDAILEGLGGLPKTTIVFPNMEKIHSMHSKLMLLFHRHRSTGAEWLRIAVPSANLTDYDWGEGGTMENNVFIIDLPKLGGSAVHKQTMFQTELTFFCQASDYPKDILTRLPEYDFSATAPMAFVHSIGGTHYSPTITRTGYAGLGTAISALGYNSGPGLELDIVTSSLGFTDKAFIMHMYRAAQGFDGTAELARRPPLKMLSRKQRERLPKPTLPRPVRGGRKRTIWADDDTAQTASESESTLSDVSVEHDEETSWSRVKRLLRLYFPSHATVAASKGGVLGGGTLCFQSESWGKTEYPRSVVRDCKNVREGILIHDKILFVRPSRTLQAKSGRRVEAWAYVGSANFTVSAW